MNTRLLWSPHRKCMVKILIGRKQTFERKDFEIFLAGQAVATTNEPNFKIIQLHPIRTH